MKKIISAQLSSVHSPLKDLKYERVIRDLEEKTSEIDLDILLVGWEEIPDLFHNLTNRSMRISNEVFLWYPFLSDYPGFDATHLVVNHLNQNSTGWDGYKGTKIKESFKQACPNNPQTVETSITHLLRLLNSYDFDGVFIDKIRFPSMANGLNDVFTCFCSYCKEKASLNDLDLNEVNIILQNPKINSTTIINSNIPPGAPWLNVLLENIPLIKKFIRFRADSINAVVENISDKMQKVGKAISLDLFSPCIAPIVGQDYYFLREKSAWIKPMIYRFGNGPSSLRSEIPALIRELGYYLGLNNSEAMGWVNEHVSGLEQVSLKEIEKQAPLTLIDSEIKTAVNVCGKTPVYLGLETVSIPGKMTISPNNVEDVIKIGEANNVAGYVISWDILHTPIENILPLKKLSRKTRY